MLKIKVFLKVGTLKNKKQRIFVIWNKAKISILALFFNTLCKIIYFAISIVQYFTFNTILIYLLFINLVLFVNKLKVYYL